MYRARFLHNLTTKCQPSTFSCMIICFQVITTGYFFWLLLLVVAKMFSCVKNARNGFLRLLKCNAIWVLYKFSLCFAIGFNRNYAWFQLLKRKDYFKCNYSARFGETETKIHFSVQLGMGCHYMILSNQDEISCSLYFL